MFVKLDQTLANGKSLCKICVFKIRYINDYYEIRRYKKKANRVKGNSLRV